MSKKVHINKKLSSKKILELLNDNEDLEEITCPKSIYCKISPKYIEALSELNILVIEGRKKTKSKYSEEVADKIITLIKNGKKPKQLFQETKIPKSAIYNIIRQYNKNNPTAPIKLKQGYQKKYTEQETKKVIEMYESGFKAKEISEKLNIPIRTIYRYIKKERNNILKNRK
ncbi:MAG: resolvase [Methanobacteriaceae archaeon]